MGSGAVATAWIVSGRKLPGQEILVHSEGQLLYSHATCWTEPPPCVPDITTILYQRLDAPWGERMGVDEQGEVCTTPADDSPAEDIAARVAATEPENGEVEQHDPHDRLLEVLRAMDPLASFRNPSGGRRSPLWEGGPVKSHCFR